MSERLSGAADRGDVPGWVLVVVMTAGSVVGLAAVAGVSLSDGMQWLTEAFGGY